MRGQKPLPLVPHEPKIKMVRDICKQCPRFKEEHIITEVVNGVANTAIRFVYCTSTLIGYGKNMFSYANIPDDCSYKLEYLMLNQDLTDAPKH